MTPPNILRYGNGTYTNMKAVIAGHSLQELYQDVGTVFLIRSQASEGVAPDRNDWVPKKYVLKRGVNVSWFTTTCCVHSQRTELPPAVYALPYLSRQ